MSSIDGLFEQIIHYEKTAQERKNFLQELRQAVSSTEKKGRNLKNNYTDMKNQLVQKIAELSDKELVCKWLSSQETIYKQQQADLEKQLKELTDEQECVLKKLREEKEDFCTKISSFSAQFGPRNCGSAERESGYTSQLASLLQEKDQLISGLQKVSAREEAVNSLCAEKEKLKTQLEKIICENKKLTSSLCVELQKTSDLEDERQAVSNLPNTDPEFTSIQEQLGAERQVSVELEEKYSMLQSQLHQLHQKLWHQQLKQQQKHSQQQQLHNDQQQLCYDQQQFTQQQHSEQQSLFNPKSHNSKKEGSQPLLTARPDAWQQNGNMERGIWRGQQKSSVYRPRQITQQHNFGQTLQKNEDQSETSSKLTNKVMVSDSSQQNTETDSCLDDCSDVLFSDSDDLSLDNQRSQEHTEDIPLP